VLTTHRYPNEVIIEDSPEDAANSGTNTPSGEPAGDDFFSSWDKPSIKRPSNPPSRTGTPSNANRTASPFLNANANGNGIARSKSPLAPLEGDAPAAPKAISTSAVRKTAVSSKPKANILGAKKTKLGAKKVDASALDFDEAEKKAREEAERKERLGYDPEDETPSEARIKASQPDTAASTIHAPTPLSPRRPSGFGATAAPKTDGEMERLGMGVRRLGFGQVGGGAAKGAAPKAAMGFGSTGKAPVVGESFH
jgi:ADP-ribosylation factor GTPase-activating protein 2/3